MHRTVAIIALLTFAAFWSVDSVGSAATYRLDLSDLIEPGADFALTAQVDLGASFTRIDHAALEFEGIFTPGLIQRDLISGSAPIVPSDIAMLSIVMGDPGTTRQTASDSSLYDRTS